LIEVLAIMRWQNHSFCLRIRHIDEDIASHVVETRMGEAEAPGREIAVAALLVFGRLLEYEDASPRFLSRDRRTKRGIACPDDDYIIVLSHHGWLLSLNALPRSRCCNSTERE